MTAQRPSAAIRDRYERALEQQVDRMGRSLARWLIAAYRANPPVSTVLYGQDASPMAQLRAAMRKLSRLWLKRFDEFAEPTADLFARRTQDAVRRGAPKPADSGRRVKYRRGELRNAGLTVRYKPTAAMREAFDAVRTENVSLIKSIASQHLDKVEQLVTRSVGAGYDLSIVAKGLEKQLGVTKRRAAFIARDQAGKSHAMMQRAQYLEIGYTKGKWLHSAGGHVPRPEHVAFSGKVFDLAKGHDFGDGEGPTWPGIPINCKCVMGVAIEGIDY